MANALDYIISEEKRYAAIPYVESGANHQKFSDIVNAYGLAGYQNAAWCATYQFALELLAFGKDTALAHWCMTNNYCGYNVFATRDKFKAAGKTGSTPMVGALVIFKRSHMGRVLSVDSAKKTFLCGEGNTSNKEFSRDGDSCAVKTYSWSDSGIDCFCYIDYGSDTMDVTKLINAAKAVYEMAHNLHFQYGDSKTLPPCEDHLISCDRLIARALWNLGYTDQPKGGITVSSEKWMEPYLLRWGFKKIPAGSGLKAGDIVVLKQHGTTAPTAAWHTYLTTAVTVSGGVTLVNKYDMGSQQRIDSPQPFVGVPVNQWADKSVYCIFRWGDNEGDTYKLDLSRVVAGSTGKSQLAANRILKARGYKGIKKDGIEQELELNNKWTNGDIAALVKYKWDRMINGKNLCTGILADEINTKVFEDLFGMTPPIQCVNVPDKCRSGPLVLWLQEILRSEGFVGKDGLPIGLDQQFGENTEYSVKQYQKRYGLAQTGKVTYSVWKHMCNTVK